jgi:hypothetical protein
VRETAVLYDVVGLISLLLMIWGIVSVVQSSESSGGKILWVLILVLLNLVGFVIWYLFGPGSKELPLRR